MLNTRWILMLDVLFVIPNILPALSAGFFCLKVFAYDTVKLVRILDRRLGCAQSLDDFSDHFQNFQVMKKQKDNFF